MSGQGYRTRANWTTDEKPAPLPGVQPDPAWDRPKCVDLERVWDDVNRAHRAPASKPAPTWVWGAVFVVAAVLILLLVQVDAFR